VGELRNADKWTTISMKQLESGELDSSGSGCEADSKSSSSIKREEFLD
jgi:hypothetical protein